MDGRLQHRRLAAQQRPNYETAVDITRYVRSVEPAGVTISIGGEIGEVGTENSTVEELHAYMRGFDRTLAEIAPGSGRPQARTRLRRT